MLIVVGVTVVVVVVSQLRFDDLVGQELGAVDHEQVVFGLRHSQQAASRAVLPPAIRPRQPRRRARRPAAATSAARAPEPRDDGKDRERFASQSSKLPNAPGTSSCNQLCSSARSCAVPLVRSSLLHSSGEKLSSPTVR